MSGYDGFGNFTRGYNWVNDKLALFKIQAARMDDEFNIYATGMNQVMLRNGVAGMSGDLKMGGNKITGIGAGLVGMPGLAYTADATTGIYFPAAGVVAFTAAGVERARANNVGFCVPTGQSFGVGTNAPRTTLDFIGITSLQTVFETATVSATAIAGTVNVDMKTQAVVVYDSNASANFAFNIRGDGAASLDSILATGQALTVAIEVPMGGTAYYCTAVTVDGSAPSQIKWYNGGAPLAGNVNGIDVYVLTVIKKAAATFYVRGSMAQAK